MRRAAPDGLVEEGSSDRCGRGFGLGVQRDRPPKVGVARPRAQHVHHLSDLIARQAAEPAERMAKGSTAPRASSAVPSLYQLLPSSSIPLPSYALPLSHRDQQTTTHLANLLNNSTSTSLLHAYLHALNLPPPNATGTHPAPRKPRKRPRLGEAETGTEHGSESEGETTRAGADGEESGMGRDRTKPRRTVKEEGKSRARRLPGVNIEGVEVGEGE